MQNEQTPLDQQTETAKAERRTHATIVHEALHELWDLGIRPIDTAALIRATGLQRLQVSEAIKVLRAKGDISDTNRGYYEPVFKHPPSQALSITAIPLGGVKIEKGDQVMELTPYEWKYELAPFAAGASAQTAVMELTHQTLVLTAKLNKAVAQFELLKKMLKSDQKQLEIDLAKA
jgi:hypothetical protein